MICLFLTEQPSLFLRYNACPYDYRLLCKYQLTMYYYMYVWRNPEVTVKWTMPTPEDLQEGLAVRGQTQSITLRVTRQIAIGH